MVARPCRARGCPSLIKSKEQRGFCDTHAAMRSNWNARVDRAGSTTQRGYGAAWQRLRMAILDRDHHMCKCVECKRIGRVRPAHEVDHIIAKAKGGTDAPGNLQAINRDCHRAKTANDSKLCE